MKQTRLMMDMPITICVEEPLVQKKDIDTLFDYFQYIDDTFSPFKETSEVSKINLGYLKEKNYSRDVKTILTLAEKTKKETNGYFDITHKGNIDPSGIVKGWAIYNAADILEKKGFKNYYIDAGGDLEIRGNNKEDTPWIVGIRNPFNRRENIQILSLTNMGIATSGTAIRGQHIYNPHLPSQRLTTIVSLTVIGPNVYDADRFATAAFAMGNDGIHFIEKLSGFEGYSIDVHGIATYTSNFKNYVYDSNN